MKMNIEIDLSEIYSEYEDFSVKQTIIDEVSHNVKQKVSRLLDDKIKKEIEKSVISKVDEIMKSRVDATLEDILMKKTYNIRGDELTLDEYVEKKFIGHLDNHWGVDHKLKERCELLAKELKSRYDASFAAQFVAKLANVGVLNPDYHKLIIE